MDRRAMTAAAFGLLFATIGLWGPIFTSIVPAGQAILPPTTGLDPSPPSPSRAPAPEAALGLASLPQLSPSKQTCEETPRLQPTGVPPSLFRYQPLPFAADPALEQQVRFALADADQRMGLVVKNLADGRGVAINADRLFYAASHFKMWVMLEAFHQREAGLLDFDDRYTVSEYYRQAYGVNEGELEEGDVVSVKEALKAMIAWSDNVAAGLLLDRTGLASVNEGLLQLGLTRSSISAEGSLITTAADTAFLLEAIARGRAVTEEASAEMLALLASQVINHMLPAFLPEGTPVAHKTGSGENATHDVGIVFSSAATYVIVVLTDYGFEEEGASLIAHLSRLVYDYYNGATEQTGGQMTRLPWEGLGA